MVVGLELRAADVPEVADPAVPAGPRVRLVVPLERRQEPLAHAAVVRVELGDAEALPLAAAVLDVHALDRRALQPLDDLGVEQELEHVRGLRRPRELRVDRLVGPLRRLLEEVREAVPAPVLALEVRLVDDVGRAVAHRLLREPPRHVGVEALVVVGRDPDDRAALALEPLEVRRLVLAALAEDEVDGACRRRAAARAPARDLERERRQVRAGEVRREVGGREPEACRRSGGAHDQYRPSAGGVLLSGCTGPAPTRRRPQPPRRRCRSSASRASPPSRAGPSPRPGRRAARSAAAGTTCHESPKRSFTHPHGPCSPPSVSASE